MTRNLRSIAALGVFALLSTSGCTGAYVTTQLLADGGALGHPSGTETAAPSGFGQPAAASNYPRYSCSATNCSLGTIAEHPGYPPVMLAVGKTTTIISLSDEP